MKEENKLKKLIKPTKPKLIPKDKQDEGFIISEENKGGDSGEK